ncbi:MAG TPA: response regulator [Gemmataceae bacterium]|nr:response regulator [Gemmataceae bacterium]
MPDNLDGPETVLIVDDEEPVRRTFREWLEGAGLGCRILAAADAEAALTLANQHTIDLAVLDWNLGAGSDGLHLLEDLSLFNPDVVAILITGFAHQATPLDAMRMGVRDYLDKNQDLTRETFLRAVRKQLDRIRPARRERRLHQTLVAFREAVEKVLPLARSAAALTDPVPLSAAVYSLFRFLLRTTGARDGALVVRHYDPARQPPETVRAYDITGRPVAGELAPFPRSLAGTVVSISEPCAMGRPEEAAQNGAVELQPFERGRSSLLAAPLAAAPGVHVVLELFDKPAPGFTDADRALVGAAAEFGAEMVRQALAEDQARRTLFDAVEAALRASEHVASTLRGTAADRLEEPPPPQVLEQLKAGLSAGPAATPDADETLRLAEAVRVLALRHGPAALRHCTRLVEGLRELLDAVTGAEDGRA